MQKRNVSIIIDGRDQSSTAVDGQWMLLNTDRVVLKISYCQRRRGEGFSGIDILIENMGACQLRSWVLAWDTQRKGISDRCLQGSTFLTGNLEQYPLPLDNLGRLIFKGWTEDSQPLRFRLYCWRAEGYLLRLVWKGLVKGAALSTRRHLGRFLERQATLSLTYPS